MFALVPNDGCADSEKKPIKMEISFHAKDFITSKRDMAMDSFYSVTCKSLLTRIIDRSTSRRKASLCSTTHQRHLQLCRAFQSHAHQSNQRWQNRSHSLMTEIVKQRGEPARASSLRDPIERPNRSIFVTRIVASGCNCPRMPAIQMSTSRRYSELSSLLASRRQLLRALRVIRDIKVLLFE